MIFLLAILCLIVNAEQRLLQTGGWSDPHEPSSAELEIWGETVEANSEYLMDDGTAVTLSTFGTPIEVSTQVVAGMNYKFEFSNGAEVTVFYQSWTNTLSVTKVEQPESSSREEPETRPPEEEPTREEDEEFEDEEAFIAGGVSSGHAPTDEEIELWYDAVENAVVTGMYGENDLLSLNNPVSVQTQVVSGVMYYFTFADGTVVKVYSQPWTGTLQIQTVDNSNTSSQTRGRRLQELLAGGITQSDNCADCDKWQEVLDCGSACMSLEGYEAFDYVALGEPISSATQVVAGTNYFFEFADQTRITVLEQVWMNPSLQITNIDAPATDTRDETTVTDARTPLSKQDENACPENQVWLNCQSACPLTCGEPEIECMSLVCIEGCGCESGKYLDGEKCVDKVLCGSNTPRTPKYPGATVRVLDNKKIEKTPR